MAEGATDSVAFRRRREGKTSYKKRRNLLGAGKPRAVIRMTNRQTIVQLVTYAPEGDQTRAAFRSDMLEAYGWDAPSGNIPAAYLTGYACGLIAQSHDIGEAVADIGLQTPHPRGRLFAAVRGLRDAGVHVPADENVIPEKRVEGDYIANFRDIKLPVDAVKETLEESLGD